MRRVPSLLVVRVVFVLLGAVWAVRSVQSFSDPDFTDPGTVSDWVAVLLVTVGLALLPIALVFLTAVTGRRERAVRWLVPITAVGATVAAIANLAEDGLGIDAAAVAYYLGAATMLVGLVLLAVVLVVGRPRWPALVVLGTVVGLIGLESAGGLLIMTVWVVAAVEVRPGGTMTSSA